MATQSTVTVTTSATLLAPPPTWWNYVLSVMPVDGTIYVGDSTVTTSGATKGRAVVQVDHFAIDLPQNEMLYGIAASSVEVSVLTVNKI